MIRARLFLIIFCIAIGMVGGYYLEGFIDPDLKFNADYETISNGYLSKDVDALELVVMLEDLAHKHPVIVRDIMSILQQNEIILRVPSGGKFKAVKTVKSNLSPKHLFVELESVDSGTRFWVMVKSIKKIREGEHND